jgi:hypothetical protein
MVADPRTRGDLQCVRWIIRNETCAGIVMHRPDDADLVRGHCAKIVRAGMLREPGCTFIQDCFEPLPVASRGKKFVKPLNWPPNPLITT